MTDPATIKSYITKIENELLQNILPFWIAHTVDKENGGFYGEISNELVVNPHASKGALLNARILWTYASAYRRYQTPAYLDMAHYAYQSLIDLFWDNDYGGLYWEISADHTPTKPRKQIYGQAFGIYALSEYYAVTGAQTALDKAIGIFNAMEKYAYDPVHGGYYEAFSQSWGPVEDLRLSAVDLNSMKSQNTHLHILEAFTNLLRVWDNTQLKRQQTALIEVMLHKITNPLTHHLILFQDGDWTPRSDHVSYGHDIEASWLLVEAAEVLGDHNLVEVVKARCLTMAQAVYEQGLDTDGSLFYESAPGGKMDTEKSWWPQVEAAVGFLNAYQISGQQHFMDAALKSWDYIEGNLIDRTYGGWYSFGDRDTPEHQNVPKVSFWKCPYHNARACMELRTRLLTLLDEDR